MKKQKKQLLLLIIALVLLAAAFFGLKQYNKVQSEKAKEEAENSENIAIDVQEEDIVRLTYDYDGATYTFEKEGDTWYYAEDHSLTISENQIEAMTSKLAPFQVQQTIENVTDMEQYGLTTPTRTIQYETEGETIVLEVGNYNTMSSVYYVRKASESTVYTVTGSVITSFNRSLEDVVVEEETAEAGDETGSSEETAEAGGETGSSEETAEAGDETGSSEETAEAEDETGSSEGTAEAEDGSINGE